MPRKQDQSGAKRKTTATPKSSREQPKTKAARAAGKGTKTSASAAKKSTAAKPARAKPVAAKKSAAAKKPATKTGAKPRTAGAAPRKRAGKKESESGISAANLASRFEDPIGDTTDGEAHRLLADEAEPESGAAVMEAYRADTTSEAKHGLTEAAREPVSGETEADATAFHPEPHLDRLQKILSQAGIASRRHAEEMIVAGRVMVNGQVITQLGAKADPARDHVRVDGKLIRGEERRRTFLLNKPKGYVTTVSDPEGRPTVTQFFAKMRERLYPVGRLDYQSEGLLLMTNDGELANSLTRAAAGVEKTYLVKVAGQPGEGALDQLRKGVSIDREQPGSGRVRTAPASVRQVRPGDNPWYEVVLTEGRNRELRKMFQAIGHYVEKIRRVGYGPLALDVEPGRFRELTGEEVNALRLTAEGKLKPGRPKSSAMLPREAGRATEARPSGAAKNRPSSAGWKERGDERDFRREGRNEARQEPQRNLRRDDSRRDSGSGFATRREGGRSGAFRGRNQREGSRRGQFEPRRFGGKRGGFRRNEDRGFAQPDFHRPSDEGHGGEGNRQRFDRPQGNRGPGFDRGRQQSGPREPGDRQRFGGRSQPRGDFERRGSFGQRNESGGEGPRFEKSRRFERPEREGFSGSDRRDSFSGENRSAGREFRPRNESRGERPKRFGAPRFDRERGGDRQRPEGERPNRPQRFDLPAHPGGRSQRGSRGFGSRPSGFPKPGFRGKPGGGPPRRGRG